MEKAKKLFLKLKFTSIFQFFEKFSMLLRFFFFVRSQSCSREKREIERQKTVCMCQCCFFLNENGLALACLYYLYSYGLLFLFSPSHSFRISFLFVCSCPKITNTKVPWLNKNSNGLRIERGKDVLKKNGRTGFEENKKLHVFVFVLSQSLSRSLAHCTSRLWRFSNSSSSSSLNCIITFFSPSMISSLKLFMIC